MTMGPLEIDTCKDKILPALEQAGWAPDQIRPEYYVKAKKSDATARIKRDPVNSRVDYVLEIVPGLPVAVVEAKREYRAAADGLGQAVRYGEQLDVPVAYASNGLSIIEKHFGHGTENHDASFRSPAELWSDYCEFHGLDPADAELLKEGANRRKRTASGDVAQLRWYQQVAVNRVLTGIARGDKRLLLLMATGTGKTFTAMQIVHKLRNYHAAIRPDRNYRVLYLADRDALVSQPMKKDFGIAFTQDPLARILGRDDGKSRDIVFGTYQSLATSGEVSRLHRYKPDFFDLVIVDECHRGSADEQSQWHEVLEYFSSSVQLGLTATPKQDETVDTYRYFGEPVFKYSLRQGIEDGYLAPYRLRRVVLDVDADGWEPEPGEVDDAGFTIEEGVYGTRDFERRLVLTQRTEIAAKYLMGRLREKRGRMIIFCADVDHATRMRKAMVDLAPDWNLEDPSWIVRITSSDDDSKRLVEALSDPDTDSPLVATTSRLLATGVDIEDLKYVVLFRPIGSQIEFKQIVGRGTRLYPEKGKTSFEIIDFVGASSHFSDPDFDGFPTGAATVTLGPDGEVATETPDPIPIDEATDGAGAPDPTDVGVAEPVPPFGPSNPTDPDDVFGGNESDGGRRRHRHVVSRASVSLLAESLYVPDTSTNRLRLTEYAEHVGNTVRSFADSPRAFGHRWAHKPEREAILAELAAMNIDVQALTPAGGEPVDPFDALVALAFDQPSRTRAERARLVRKKHFAELEAMSVAARQVIEALLDRYESSGIDDAISSEALNLPPLSGIGTRREVLGALGDTSWSDAVTQVQEWVYSTETAS